MLVCPLVQLVKLATCLLPLLLQVFSIVPLSLNEWALVLLFALPVILIDELLKLLGRNFFGVRPTAAASEARAKRTSMDVYTPDKKMQ